MGRHFPVREFLTNWKSRAKSHKILKVREFQANVIYYRVPTRTGKPGKMGRHFPVGEKSGNFEQTGKVRENDTKYWKIQAISEKYYL